MIASTTNYFDYVTSTINLDCCIVHLDYNVEKLKALKEKYGDGIEITDPGQIGSVLITGNLESITTENMLSEFKIEPLDDYLSRSLEHHKDNKGK